VKAIPGAKALNTQGSLAESHFAIAAVGPQNDRVDGLMEATGIGPIWGSSARTSFDID
jgi:hypothetical protein